MSEERQTGNLKGVGIGGVLQCGSGVGVSGEVGRGRVGGRNGLVSHQQSLIVDTHVDRRIDDPSRRGHSLDLLVPTSDALLTRACGSRVTAIFDKGRGRPPVTGRDGM